MVITKKETIEKLNENGWFYKKTFRTHYGEDVDVYIRKDNEYADIAFYNDYIQYGSSYGVGDFIKIPYEEISFLVKALKVFEDDPTYIRYGDDE